ncbi:MAG TPA: hypothetical protein VKD21_16870 [Acidimicrobiales bacterium]|nr:hypothetical protein [Acidimicrobiales bacterium]
MTAGSIAEPATTVEEGRAAAVERPWPLRPGSLAGVSVVAAVAPVVVATARAVAGGWRAISDNAFFGLRAADVFTEHHPLLGVWTSASVEIGKDVNNPGPLQFDLLALPVRIWGPHAGIAVGVGLLNVASILGIAAVARRRAGAPAVVAAMLAATGLGWAMGSELLFDPWQPHSLLYPFLCFLFVVWALASGDLVMLPWAVGLGSLIVQTHIVYALLVPALGLWGVAAAGTRWWRSRRADPQGWPAERRRAGRLVAVAAVVAAVCWAQPLVEQFFGDGPGNLGMLAASVGDTGDAVGWGDAPRFVARVVALPPWWGRPSMTEAFPEELLVPGRGRPLPSLGASLAGLAVVGGLLLGAWRGAARRGAAPAAWAAATGLVVLGFALLVAAAMPVGVLDVVGAHQMRWLWPVATFLTFALVLALTAGRGRWAGGERMVPLVVAATVLLATLNLPSMNSGAGLTEFADTIPSVRRLLPQLEVLRGEAGVLVDTTGQRLAEPYTTPVLAELQQLGVPWYTEDRGLQRYAGPSRAYHGQDVPRLIVREGDAARTVPDGARRVAFVDGLGPGEAEELASLQAELRPFIAAGGIAVRPGTSAATGLTASQLRDPDRLLPTGALVGLVRDDRLDVPPRWAAVLGRYAELQSRADRLTAAVFVEPREPD